VTTVHPLRGLGWLLDLWETSLRPRVGNAELHVFSAALERGFKGGEVAASIRPIFDRAMALAGQGVVIARPRSDPGMAEAYRVARVHLHPGHGDEVYCSTLAESQAVGLPAVVRRAAAATERIRDGESGFVVPDDEAFTNCAMLLLTADNVFEGRSRDARAHQRGRTWDDAAAEFETLFK
jgi:glycosyltransferase involved in cell wall biosynthesis